MTTVVSWPEGVPWCVEPLYTSGGLVDNRRSFETDKPGQPIERPEGSWAPELYSVQLVPLSIAQFRLFQSWYVRDLRSGVLPFKWFHPITGDVSAWKITKASPPYQVTKIGAIPPGSGLRRIALSFSAMSVPLSFEPDYLEQEQGDLVLQEQGDRIIVSDGFDFSG